MTFNLVAKVFCLVAALVAAPLVPVKSLAAPETGMLNTEDFLSDKDAICAIGNDLSKGCDAIRSREIVDASQEPWISIGRVNYAGRRTRSHCTGTLVSERLVLTASHCLYNHHQKSWIPAREIRFVAGFQRGRAQGVSRVAKYILDPVHDLDSRDFRAAPGQDWALLVLHRPIGKDVGYLRPVALSPGDLGRRDAFLAGYSGLRQFVLTIATDCGRAEPRPETRTFTQTCSAMRGDSGAPILTRNGGEVQVVGVLSGIAIRPSGIESIGIPISVFNDALRSAMNE